MLETEGIDADTEHAGGDLHHDEWLMPVEGSALDALAAEVFDATERLTDRGSRKPRADALQRRKLVVGNLVANLAVLVRHHRPGRRLAVSAKNVALTRYARRNIPREVLAKTLGALESAGVTHRSRGTRQRVRTTVAPTADFRERLLATNPGDVTRAEGAETIVLRARTGTRGRGASSSANQKVLIDYADTDETRAMREEMERVNHALAAANITHQGERLAPFLLFRAFVIASPDAPHTFDQHGRIFGGPWIGMPRAERHGLRINGEPLADLDFTGMFVQLAYLAAGLPLPEGDPYMGVAGLTDGNALEGEGLARDAVKRAVAALLCRSGPMRKLPAEIKRRLGDGWTATRLTAALAERHPGIAHLFGADVGVRLMFTESRILVRTLRALLADGIPALPVHDGLMVAASRRAQAEAAMRRASEETLGIALPVKAQDLHHPNNSPPMPYVSPSSALKEEVV